MQRAQITENTLFHPIRIKQNQDRAFLFSSTCTAGIFLRPRLHETGRTLIGGNIQRSDDVKNKPSNKGHQKGKGGSKSSDLGSSENRARLPVTCFWLRVYVAFVV